MIKVQPKPFTSPTGRTINIVGIIAKFVNEFPITVSPITNFQFYIEFITESGEKRDVINASSSEFHTYLRAQGLPEEQVKLVLDQTFAALLVGTLEQRYAAISGLVGFYGYTALPLVEQDGQQTPIIVPVIYPTASPTATSTAPPTVTPTSTPTV